MKTKQDNSVTKNSYQLFWECSNLKKDAFRNFCFWFSLVLLATHNRLLEYIRLYILHDTLQLDFLLLNVIIEKVEPCGFKKIRIWPAVWFCLVYTFAILCRFRQCFFMNRQKQMYEMFFLRWWSDIHIINIRKWFIQRK